MALNEVTHQHLVVFDGVCKLCNRAVNFIIKRDPDAKFLFVPIQSPLARGLMEKHRVNQTGVDTFVLIKAGQCFTQSDAALAIAKDLSGCWPMLRFLSLFPRSLRDYVYRVIARNRYRIFGRYKACKMPDEDYKSRFLD